MFERDQSSGFKRYLPGHEPIEEQVKENMFGVADSSWIFAIFQRDVARSNRLSPMSKRSIR
nr:hypothetical protein SHINE37_100293 [Rhizobiaceae bacterium]